MTCLTRRHCKTGKHMPPYKGKKSYSSHAIEQLIYKFSLEKYINQKL